MEYGTLGLGGNWYMKRTRSKKSRDTVPLRDCFWRWFLRWIQDGFNFLQTFVLAVALWLWYGVVCEMVLVWLAQNLFHKGYLMRTMLARNVGDERIARLVQGGDVFQEVLGWEDDDICQPPCTGRQPPSHPCSHRYRTWKAFQNYLDVHVLLLKNYPMCSIFYACLMQGTQAWVFLLLLICLFFIVSCA